MAAKERNAEELVREYNVLRGRRGVWESTWQELAEYIVPRKATVVRQTLFGGGEKRTRQLFDSTAVRANQKLSAAIHGSLTSPVVRWFNLNMRDTELNKVHAVRIWLEKVKTLMFTSIRQSNFDGEIQEIYTELGAFGTAALYSEEGQLRGGLFGGLHFESLPIGSYAITEDAEGKVDQLHRVLTLTPVAMAKKWGEDALPAQVKEKLKVSSTKYAERQVLHSVFRRKTVAAEFVRPTTGPVNRPFASMYTDIDLKADLAEGGYFEFPFAVPRWSRQTGEVYGRGQGEIALPDIRTLNKATESRLQAWALALRPPLLARHRGVIGRIRMTPAGITSVRDKDSLTPLEAGTRFDVANFQEQDIRMSIKEIFFNNQLELPDKSIITATEADRRVEMMMRILGPTLGRLDDELLRVKIDRLFAIMLRSGVLDPIPLEVIEAARSNLGDIEVEYDGPLAKAQRASQLVSTAEFLELIPVMEEMQPGTRDNVNFDEILRDSHASRSLPAQYLRDGEEVTQIRVDRVTQAQEDKANEDAAMAGAAIGQAGPGLKALSEITPGDTGGIPIGGAELG